MENDRSDHKLNLLPEAQLDSDFWWDICLQNRGRELNESTVGLSQRQNLLLPACWAIWGRLESRASRAEAPSSGPSSACDPGLNSRIPNLASPRRPIPTPFPSLCIHSSPVFVLLLAEHDDAHSSVSFISALFTVAPRRWDSCASAELKKYKHSPRGGGDSVGGRSRA